MVAKSTLIRTIALLTTPERDKTDELNVDKYSDLIASQTLRAVLHDGRSVRVISMIQWSD